jgi:SAM-dependent methyltransferase
VSEVTPRADVDPERCADPSDAYDVVAGRYAERFGPELESKPFDRELLARFADALPSGRGPGRPALVCDLGCGPAHIGAFLHKCGPEVIGVDRSIGMLAQARRGNPSMALAQGDMRDLGLRCGALDGIACFYALIHIPRSEVPHVLEEMHRVLTAGGPLLLAVHGGEGSLHATRMLECPVDLDATLFTLPELVGLLEGSGFAVVEAHERDPYDGESPTRRLYLWARRQA